MWKLAAGLLLLAGTASAETVHSLDQVPSRLKTPEARETFREQIVGKPAPDRLGTHLPAALPATAIRRLLVPGDDRAAATVVGARPWRSDLDVAIVCTGGAAPLDPQAPQCSRADPGSKEPPLHIYLGVIEVKDAAPKLIAKSGAVDCAMRWDDSGLPRQPVAADDAQGAPIAPDSVDRFDLAPYTIAPGQTAFGLRGTWNESYSGGGASYTGLCLFAAAGAQLKEVLALPMSAYADIAGDWHKDGTRDHDITDADNVLLISKHATEGHFDLVVKNRKGRWQRTFRWSQAAGAYLAAGK
jgi:hypothetical protein